MQHRNNLYGLAHRGARWGWWWWGWFMYLYNSTLIAFQIFWQFFYILGFIDIFITDFPHMNKLQLCMVYAFQANLLGARCLTVWGTIINWPKCFSFDQRAHLLVQIVIRCCVMKSAKEGAPRRICVHGCCHVFFCCVVSELLLRICICSYLVLILICLER